MYWTTGFQYARAIALYQRRYANAFPPNFDVLVEQIAAELVKSRGYKNKHQVPKLVKVSINTGIDADADKNQIADVALASGAPRG